MTVGWLTMIPYICGGIALVVWGRISDRMNERRWNLLAACVLSTGGLVLAGLTLGTLLGAGRHVDRGDGLLRFEGPVLRHAADVPERHGLAAGFAWINSIGNLGGFFGPWYVGVMKDATGNFAGGLFGLALLSLIAAVGVRVLPAHPRPDDAGGGSALAPARSSRVSRPLLASCSRCRSFRRHGLSTRTADPPDRAVPAGRRHRCRGPPDWRTAGGRSRSAGDRRNKAGAVA